MSVVSIKNVAVLGLGTMGHGIAQTMAVAGRDVRCYDASADMRDSAKTRMRANLKQMAEAGLVDGGLTGATLDRVTICDDEATAVEGAEYVTEAVIEDLELKKEIFARLDALVPGETILASNTSSYPITQIAERMQHKQRALVTHWFNPPHVIPVVEVVPGEDTSDATADIAYDFLTRIGKVAVRVNKEIPGFLVNRVQIAMFREIWDLLDRGVASAEDIDRAIRGSVGLRLAALGPLAVIDFAGWDVTGKVYQNLIPDLRSDTELPQSIRRLLDEGRLGVKTGQGIYNYPADSAQRSKAERDQTYLELIKLLKRHDGPKST